jgi:DNA mismatch repair protein MutL
MAALEQAFRSYMPQKRFPAAVLKLNVPPKSVDVNVHPAKLEVKFANEQPVFEAIYHTVRDALEKHEYRPELTLGKQSEAPDPRSAFVPIGADTKGTQISFENTLKDDNGALRVSSGAAIFSDSTRQSFSPPTVPSGYPRGGQGTSYSRDFSERTGSAYHRPESYRPSRVPQRSEMTPARSLELLEKYKKTEPESFAESPVVSTLSEDTVAPNTHSLPTGAKIIGEAFDCYVFVEYEGALLVIDKHAAHERIIFEDLRRKSELGTASSQVL